MQSSWHKGMLGKNCRESRNVCHRINSISVTKSVIHCSESGFVYDVYCRGLTMTNLVRFASYMMS